jgi:regulator of protease activity HflC (stomatin/prohibitin superfamily)
MKYNSVTVVFVVKASYGVEDAEYAITQLAQTTMRSEIGKISLDSVFKERESLNFSIVGMFNTKYILYYVFIV